MKARIRRLASALGLGDLLRRSIARFVADERRALAKRWLRGSGIEIGPLHYPLPLGPRARARSVDRLTLAGLRRHYPELSGLALSEPDVLDDGERLETFPDGSVDFVVANHFLEHCQNPIAAVETFLRVLRPGGRVFLAIPDMRHTFDRDRTATTFDHVWRDYRDGPQGSYAAHLGEWAGIVEKTAPESLDARVKELRDRAYSIHFHCWTQAELLEFFARLQREPGLPYDVVEFVQNGAECIVILEKSTAA